MALVAGVLGRAGEAGQKRRLQDSSRGNVSWNTSSELNRHMKKEVAAAVIKRKEVMGRMQADVQGFTDEEMKILRSQYLGEELEVTEDEMVDMMGAAALGEAREATILAGDVPSQQPGAVLEDRLGSIEAQLQSVREQTAEIEASIGKSGNAS